MFDTAAQYSVVLDRQRARGPDTVAALFGQQPSSHVALEVLLDGNQLEPGTYSLHVLKKDSHDEPLDFEFVKP